MMNLTNTWTDNEGSYPLDVRSSNCLLTMGFQNTHQVKAALAIPGFWMVFLKQKNLGRKTLAAICEWLDLTNPSLPNKKRCSEPISIYSPKHSRHYFLPDVEITTEEYCRMAEKVERLQAGVQK